MTSPPVNAADQTHLRQQYPAQWLAAKAEVAKLLTHPEPRLINDYILQSQEQSKKLAASLQGRATPASLSKRQALAKHQMALAYLEASLRRSLAADQHAAGGLSRRDLFLAQHLFFNRQRQRKNPSLWLFRFLWPFVTSKGATLGLLQSLGIYAVFSRELVRDLNRLIAGRRCLELGAGDGTLALGLETRGAKIQAVDDGSWGDKVRYPPWVEKKDACTALREYQPQVVLCSWPPPGNRFEEAIFRQNTVEAYIVIVSKHQFASGNWQSYAAAAALGFSMHTDLRLSRLVLPPEGESQVIVFQRSSPSLH